MQSPKKPQKPTFNGPIPGENYTSNRRNQPWHRPPDQTDYVEIVDTMIKRFQNPTQLSAALTMLEEGETLADVVTGITRMGVARGAFALDQGILAAGPLARYLEAMATINEVKFERGWDQEPQIITKHHMGLHEADAPEPAPEPVEEPEAGFMTPTEASPEAQQQMLGGL